MAVENSRKDLVHVALPPEELAALDDFRLTHSAPGRAEAARTLIRLGVQSLRTDDASKKLSN